MSKYIIVFTYIAVMSLHTTGNWWGSSEC